VEGVTSEFTTKEEWKALRVLEVRGMGGRLRRKENRGVGVLHQLISDEKVNCTLKGSARQITGWGPLMRKEEDYNIRVKPPATRKVTGLAGETVLP